MYQECADERFVKAISKLRQLVAKEKNLHLGETDVIYALYLYFTDFHVDVAFERIKQVYNFKLRNREWFISLPLSKYENVLKRNASGVVKQRDNKGRRIYIVKLKRIDVNEHPPYEYSCLDDIWLTPFYNDSENIKCGFVGIIDFHDVSWSLLRFCTPHNLKVNAEKVQMYPFRHMEYHIIGLSLFVNTVFTLLKPFLSEETRRNIHMHKNLENLHQYIDKEVLPPEYGGNGTFEPELFYRHINENEILLTEIALSGYR